MSRLTDPHLPDTSDGLSTNPLLDGCWSFNGPFPLLLWMSGNLQLLMNIIQFISVMSTHRGKILKPAADFPKDTHRQQGASPTLALPNMHPSPTKPYNRS